MRRVTGAAAALGLLSFAATTFGSTVVFEPAWVSALSTPGSTAVISIGIGSGLPDGMNVADVVIGSNDLPADRNRFQFAYSDEWLQKCANVSPISTSVGDYHQEVYVGGNNPASMGVYCTLGTLTIDTGGLGDGDYQIWIDGGYDGFSGVGFNEDTELLKGFATIHIPEPASMLILILGGLFYRRS